MTDTAQRMLSLAEAVEGRSTGVPYQPIYPQTLRKWAEEITHLERQLRHFGIEPRSEFICACGLRRSAPVENEPKF